MKIGIFGGSFDPIHNGHIRLAEYALRHSDLDQLWLMVSPRNPLKDHGPIATDAQRLEMARIAVEGIEGIEVSDFEFHLPIPSYSYKTLTELKKAYPEHDFRLIIGGDNWADFSQWRNPEEIIEQFGLIVYPREGDSTSSKPNAKSPTSNITFLENAPLMPISSTEIRALLSHEVAETKERGLKIESSLPQGVADYIAKNRLYCKVGKL